MKSILLFIVVWMVVLGNLSPAYSYDIVAEVIASEAGGEGNTGMYAVACVIYHRTKLWGISPEKVVLKKNAFSCLTQQKKSTRYKHYMRHKKYVDKLSRLIREGKLVDITNGATNYYNPSRCSPKWAKGVPGKMIGHHMYIKLRWP